MEQLSWTLKEILCYHYVEPILSTTIQRNSFWEFTDKKIVLGLNVLFFPFFLFHFGLTHMVTRYSGWTLFSLFEYRVLLKQRLTDQVVKESVMKMLNVEEWKDMTGTTGTEHTAWKRQHVEMKCSNNFTAYSPFLWTSYSSFFLFSFLLCIYLSLYFFQFTWRKRLRQQFFIGIMRYYIR